MKTFTKSSWSCAGLHNARNVFVLLSRWAVIALGCSYFHVPQGLGRAFRPGSLEGYFNDLCRKTAWKGPVDQDGIRLLARPNETLTYFPTLITQQALGHWDCWLLHKDPCHFQRFLTLAHWLLSHQDEHGGWPLWDPLPAHYLSRYSAMTQGQAVSVLLRASRALGNRQFCISAEKAIRLLLTPVESGGKLRHVGHAVLLQEYPTKQLNGVLNGWIFATFGLYAFFIAHTLAGCSRTSSEYTHLIGNDPSTI